MHRGIGEGGGGQQWGGGGRGGATARWGRGGAIVGEVKRGGCVFNL